MTSVPPPAPAAPEAVRDVADDYLDALGRGDEARAVDLALGLIDAGRSAEDVLLGLVAPAQVQVGERWERGEWSVAQEHAATCVAERVAAALGGRARSRGTCGHVVVSCLDGEWHALAARVVGDVLRLRGWRVTFLGASVPPAHLVSFLHQYGPDVVALSAALPTHLPSARHTVAAVQRTGTPVLAGGPGFGVDGGLARRLGVDAWAPTAVDAAALLERMPWPPPTPARAGDEGAEAEYAGVRERRGRLVVAAVERLRAGFPEVRLADSALDDDLGQVVDFLAAAAFFADRGLFAGRHAGPRLVVDVHGLQFCDSVGLSALIGAQRRSDVGGGRMVLRGVHGMLERVLRITGAGVLFTVDGGGSGDRSAAEVGARADELA